MHSKQKIHTHIKEISNELLNFQTSAIEENFSFITI